MSNQVFANGMEVSCKAAAGKSIAAFPDVCFTPPQTPATPPGVPIPYPNTGMASDTSGGTKTVQISGKEVMIKDSSYFKTSSGDEAGCAPKKNVITSKIKGKCYYTAWSMDVKLEGENAVRHLDLMTHNHASNPGGTPPWVYADEPAFQNSAECAKDAERVNKACKDQDPPDCDAACAKAQKCALSPKKHDKKVCCKPDTTGHHLIEVHCFSPIGQRGHPLQDLEKYRENDAPCVCASESRADGTHGVLHAVQGQLEAAHNNKRGDLCSWTRTDGKPGGVSRWYYKDARNAGVKAHQIAFPHCDEDCIKKQLDAYHKDECGMRENTPVRSDLSSDGRSAGTLTRTQNDKLRAALNEIRGVATGGST